MVEETEVQPSIYFLDSHSWNSEQKLKPTSSMKVSLAVQKCDKQHGVTAKIITKEEEERLINQVWYQSKVRYVISLVTRLLAGERLPGSSVGVFSIANHRDLPDHSCKVKRTLTFADARYPPAEAVERQAKIVLQHPPPQSTHVRKANRRLEASPGGLVVKILRSHCHDLGS
nr:uncharacterized protein LOC111773634 isoform X2 [Equus caballus]